MVGALLIAVTAWGGYGDPLDGYPSHSERLLHLWTNAARVDPEAFEQDYQDGGCSFHDDFSEDEQTPKAPVRWHLGLNEAARYHSQDMYDTGHWGHDSSDGTSFEARLARYYEGGAGENIANGYSTEYSAVFNGWMCSTTGHRANIMTASWEELGTGVVGTYYTQDFGSRGVERRAVSMGVHLSTSTTWELWADFYGDGSAPDEFLAVLDGEAHELELAYGDDDQGVYMVEVDPGSGCHEYFFQARVDGDRVRFPEDGSYGWGGCDFDDEDAGWIDDQLGIAGRDDVSARELRRQFRLVGCSSAPGLSGSWTLVPLVLLARRYRPFSSSQRRQASAALS